MDLSGLLPWAGLAGASLEGADVVVRARFVNQRVAPIPMEANGGLAAFDPETGGVRLWVPTSVTSMRGPRSRPAGATSPTGWRRCRPARCSR